MMNAPFLTRRPPSLIVFGLALLFGGAVAEAAQSVTLAWDPSPDPSVAGYYVHYGTTSQVYTGLVDTAGATSATVAGLVAGQTYYFAVTAYNQQRIESVPSGEIAYTVPAPVVGLIRILRGAGVNSPARLQFQIPLARQYEVQASEDLRSWQTIYTSVSLSTNWIEWTDPQAASLPKRFYRLVLPDKPQVPGLINIVRGTGPNQAGRLRVSVLAGRSYRIQASQDLTTWTTIHTAVSASSDPIEFTDPNAAQFQKRFYRLAFD